MLFQLAFYRCDKTLTKSNEGKERIYTVLLPTVYHQRSQRFSKFKAGTEADHGGTLLTDSLCLF